MTAWQSTRQFDLIGQQGCNVAVDRLQCMCSSCGIFDMSSQLDDVMCDLDVKTNSLIRDKGDLVLDLWFSGHARGGTSDERDEKSQTQTRLCFFFRSHWNRHVLSKAQSPPHLSKNYDPARRHRLHL